MCGFIGNYGFKEKISKYNVRYFDRGLRSKYLFKEKIGM